MSAHSLDIITKEGSEMEVKQSISDQDCGIAYKLNYSKIKSTHA